MQRSLSNVTPSRCRSSLNQCFFQEIRVLMCSWSDRCVFFLNKLFSKSPQQCFQHASTHSSTIQNPISSFCEPSVLKLVNEQLNFMSKSLEDKVFHIYLPTWEVERGALRGLYKCLLEEESTFIWLLVGQKATRWSSEEGKWALTPFI